MTLLKETSALVRDLQHGEGFRDLLKISKPDKFTADSRPLRTTVPFALSIASQLFVPPSADFFGVPSREDRNDVIDSNTKPACGTNQADARNKDVGGFRGVEGVSTYEGL